MRFVFVDEAGTSQHEPVTVVVGIVVHADTQLARAERCVAEISGSVPAQFRKDFVFHATDIWNNREYRSAWEMADRVGLMRRMMSIPQKLKLGVAFGMVRREFEFEFIENLSPEEFHHILAFRHCASKADKLIRDNADIDEIATLIAEDDPKMQRYLKDLLRAGRDIEVPSDRSMLNPTQEEQRLGYMKQETDMRIVRLRKSIHFVKKEDDIVLQIADACAFGIRRFLSNGSLGDEFCSSIFGKKLNADDFRGTISSHGTWFR